jgi:hypothetical protein
MSFGTDFASSLADELGIDVSADDFEDPESVSDQIATLREFLDSLDSTSTDALNAITESGLDLSSATDEAGEPLDIPGGPLLSLAASAERPLADVVEPAESSYQVALEQNPGRTGIA